MEKLRSKFQPLWDERTTAQFIRASRAALRKWRREKKGPTYIKVGHLIRYRPAALESWLASRTVESGERPGAAAKVAIRTNQNITSEIKKCPR